MTRAPRRARRGEQESGAHDLDGKSAGPAPGTAVKHLVVVGAGISGLAAAEAATAGAGRVPGGLQVTVLEREAEVGGKARTHADGGYLAEAGPGGFLDTEPVLDRLIERTGLERVRADDSAARRFLVRGGRLREVRPHPAAFAFSGLLGPLGLLRLAGEPFVPRGPAGADESVWGFARRRLGRQAAERLVAPMVLGVFAGDARRLSLRAAFPKLHELEQRHGSLVRGMVARRRAGTTGGPTGPAGRLTSFANGMQALPRALAECGAFDVRRSCPVTALLPAGAGRWRVVATDGTAIDADAVVLAGEPWAMATLLTGPAEGLAGELAAIDCPPVSVVALGFDAEASAKVPRGFGALIPRDEGFRMLGCLWDSHCFPGRSPRSHLLVRAMLGGAVDRSAGELDEDALVETVRRDLARLTGLTAAPVFRHVVRWPKAIPQYELGHTERVVRIEAALDRLPGLFLAGNALDGVAFGRAAARGSREGVRALEWLAGEHPRTD